MTTTVPINLCVLDERLDVATLVPATEGSAGIDVRAFPEEADEVVLAPGETRLFPLGFSMSLPPGFMALLTPRSGLGHKHGIVLGNLVGIIDADYRGSVGASLWNRSTHDFVVRAGDRVAQMIIVPIVQPTFHVVEDLDDTARGAGGFGHSGTA